MAVKRHMEKTVTVCDNPACKNETDDVYSPGWIVVKGEPLVIMVGEGRKSDGYARSTGYHSGKVLHFCSLKCVCNFLHNLREKARENEQKSQCGQPGGCSARAGNVLTGDPRQFTPNPYLGAGSSQAPLQSGQPGTTTTTITTPKKKYPLTESECTKGGHCFEVQGSVLTSNPPQYIRICKHCGKKEIGIEQDGIKWRELIIHQVDLKEFLEIIGNPDPKIFRPDCLDRLRDFHKDK